MTEQPALAPPRFDRAEPSAVNGFQAAHARLILACYRRLLGCPLLPDVDPAIRTDTERASTQAERLYRAPFVVLAHDTAADPVFFYANLTAQRLFERSWQELTQLPSRLSAEPLARSQRAHLLQQVARQGFIADYSGVRIAASGRRFLIRDARVWNLRDASGQAAGQAAAFSDWRML